MAHTIVAEGLHDHTFAANVEALTFIQFIAVCLERAADIVASRHDPAGGGLCDPLARHERARPGVDRARPGHRRVIARLALLINLGKPGSGGNPSRQNNVQGAAHMAATRRRSWLDTDRARP
jgi:predicted molibdopterin-dependent oxidoreductase YjgC